MDTTFSNTGNIVQLPLPTDRMASLTALKPHRAHQMPEQVPTERDRHWNEHSTDLDLGCSCDTLLLKSLPISLNATNATEKASTAAPSPHNHLSVPFSADELAARCRQLKTTGALIKKQNDLVLYLVAGTLHVDDPVHGRQHLPVLLNPVRLVLTETAPEHPGHWCIESTQGYATLNPALTTLFERMNLPTPDRDLLRSPTELISQIRAMAAQQDTVSFQDHCVLGLATFVLPSESTDELGYQLPVQVNRELVLQIAEAVESSLPASLLDASAGILQPVSGQLSALVSTTLCDQISLEPGIVPTIRSVQAIQRSSPLKVHTLSQLNTALPELTDALDTLTTLTRSIDTISRQADSVLVDIVMSVSADISLADLKQWIALSTLPDLKRTTADTANAGTPLSHDLAHDSSLALFQQALDQAVLIHTEQDTLRQQFDFSLLPDLGGLLALANELSEFAISDPDVIDAGYFSARRNFSHFCHDRSLTTPSQQLDALNTLITTEQFRQLFCQNQSYATAFGSAFQGLDTDWDQLRQRITLARSLRRVMKSDDSMRTLVNHQYAFFDWYQSVLPTLQQIAELMESADHWIVFDTELSLTRLAEHLRDAVAALAPLERSDALMRHGSSLWRMAQDVKLPDTNEFDTAIEQALLTVQTLSGDAAGQDPAVMGQVLATLDWLTSATRSTSA